MRNLAGEFYQKRIDLLLPQTSPGPETLDQPAAAAAGITAPPDQGSKPSPTNLDTYAANSGEILGLKTTEEAIQRAYEDKLLHRFVVLFKPGNPPQILVYPYAHRSRYFPIGHRKALRLARLRLGSYYDADGVMLTLTFDGNLTSLEDSYRVGPSLASAFMQNLNRLRDRRGSPRLSYFQVRQAQPQRSYLHFHNFYPCLHFAEPWQTIERLWPWGEFDIEYIPKGAGAAHIAGYMVQQREMTLYQRRLFAKYHVRFYTTSKRLRFASPNHDQGWTLAGICTAQDLPELQHNWIAEGYPIIALTDARTYEAARKIG